MKKLLFIFISLLSISACTQPQATVQESTVAREEVKTQMEEAKPVKKNGIMIMEETFVEEK